MQRLGAILASAILTFGATTNSAMASLTVDQDGLRGIKAISVLVEGIRSNSCGVTEDQVETSARYTLSQSRVHVSSGRESSLYFNVNLLSDCSAAEVTIELNTTARVVQTNNLSFDATVWRGGYLLEGGDMSSRVSSEVNILTQKFVVDWNAANP